MGRALSGWNHFVVHLGTNESSCVEYQELLLSREKETTVVPLEPRFVHFNGSGALVVTHSVSLPKEV